MTTPKKTFEESLVRLEEIVRLLDDNRTNLGNALANYEEGVEILKSCHNQLDAAQRKIEILQGTDAASQPIIQVANESDFKTT